MVHHHKEVSRIVYRLLTTLSLFLAFYLALKTRFGVVNTHEGQHFETILIVGIFLWIIITHFFHLRTKNKTIGPYQHLGLSVIIAILFFAFLGLMSFYLKGLAFSRLLVAFFVGYQWLLSIIIFNMINFLRKFTKGFHYFKRVLFIGEESHFKQVHQEVSRHPQWKMKIIGYLCFNPTDQSNEHFLGSPDTLKELIKEHAVDEIIMSLSFEKDATEIEDIINLCEKEGVRSQLIPANLHKLNIPLEISYIGSIITYRVRQIPLDSITNKFTKRAFDIVFSTLALLLLSPLYFVVALLVKIADKGPAFFVQKRTGYLQADFDCYKFRSMKVTSRKIADSQQASEADDRLLKLGALPLGKLIRKYNLDELPQFFNVLKGDMSLVGPRPHMLAHTTEFKDRLEQYMRRHSVRPGITGLAQINGFRGPTDTHDKLQGRVRYDLMYLDTWTLRLDIKILILTVFGTKTQENAF